MSDLVMDEEALNKLGLYGDALYTIEYDLPRSSDRFDTKTNKFVRSMRNKIVYTIKYSLYAHKNLDSSWIIDKQYLERAKEFLNNVKLEYLMHKPAFNMDKRIRIFPILTDKVGYEAFIDKKAEYLMQELNSSIEKVEKLVSDKIIDESKIWRCKKDLEYVESKADSLKQHESYNELVDTIVILQDTLSEYEKIKNDLKEQEKLEKESRKNNK